MKAKKCKLLINMQNGYTLKTEEFNSINSAIKFAKGYIGFAYRIFVDNKQVRSGFCEN